MPRGLRQEKVISGLSTEDFVVLFLLIGAGVFSVFCVYVSWWHRDWWGMRKARHPVLRHITVQRVCLALSVLTFILFAWLGPLSR